MNKMQIFTSPAFGQVRTITEGGKTLFCGADIAKPLAYTRPSEAVARHCKGTLKRRILTNGGEQEMLFITEGDVYRLIARSNLPEAEKFERWIFDEVIPSIRRNGGYIAGQENMTDDELVAAALIVANRRIQERERRIASLEAVVDKQRQEIAALEPVSRYVNEILASVGTVTATQIAADYSLTAQKLNKILREDGIQRKVNGQWILCMAHIGKGYVKSVTVPIERTDGRPDSKMYTRWTQKGRLMIHNLLARRGIFANVDKEN